MSAWLSLCWREWLEHKGSLGWGPMIVAGVIAGLTLLAVLVGEFGSMHVSLDEVEIDGREVFVSGDPDLGDLVDHFLSQRSWTDAELTERLDGLRHGVAAPFYVVHFLILFFVLLSAVYDERKDGTVLFWKSMPVTDTQTVLSKLITLVWLAPAVTVAMIVATQIFLFTVMSFFVAGNEHVGFARLWWHSGLTVGAFELVVGYLVQGVWALPIYAWLLFVSAAVPRLPFLWAVLAPVVPVMVERLVFGTHVLAHGIGNHLAFRALPAAGGLEDGEHHPPVALPDILALLGTADLWLGVIIGAAFIYGAIRFRGRNNEL